MNAGCGHASCVVHIKPVCLQCKHSVVVCGIYTVLCVSLLWGFMLRSDRYSDFDMKLEILCTINMKFFIYIHLHH